MQNDKADDKELHKQFVKLGNDRRKLTNELLALLPEINERGIYKKYAASIIEYAGKFGGLSKNVVLKRLRLEKYLKDKPKLKEIIKTEGMHKVAMMASLATTENEEILVDKLKNMSKAAIQELSKEMRSHDLGNKVDQGLFANSSASAVKTASCKAVPQRITIELDEEMSFLFLKIKKKIGKNLSNKEVMKKILETVEGGLNVMAKNSAKSGGKNEKNTQVDDQKVIPGDRNPLREFRLSNKKVQTSKYKIDIIDYILQKPATRHVPSKIKKQIISKTKGKCSYPNCNKPAEILHHAERFAEKHSHNSLTSLCKEHHEFAHNGLIKNEVKEINHWRLNLENEKLNQIDEQYRKNRLEFLS